MPFDAKGAKDSGGGVKGIVTKKIGPLPVWAYVVGGAAAVFLFTRGRGGSSTSPAGSGIRIPVFTPGSSSDGGIGSGGNAVGSPAQNVRGGSDTQPAGVAPATVPGGGDHGTAIGNPASTFSDAFPKSQPGQAMAQRSGSAGTAPADTRSVPEKIAAAQTAQVTPGAETGLVPVADRPALIAQEIRRANSMTGGASAGSGVWSSGVTQYGVPPGPEWHEPRD